MAAPTDSDRNNTQWWRSWHGAPTDDKWLVVARQADTQPFVVSAVAWELLDYASQHPDRGSIVGFDSETYAFKMGLDEEVVLRIIQALHVKHIIDAEHHWTNWPKRQQPRDLMAYGGLTGAEWRALRQLVFERDQYTCVYCGKQTSQPHCDHVVPLSAGGKTTPDNLVTACETCNTSKRNKDAATWLRERSR